MLTIAQKSVARFRFQADCTKDMLCHLAQSTFLAGFSRTKYAFLADLNGFCGLCALASTRFLRGKDGVPRVCARLKSTRVLGLNQI